MTSSFLIPDLKQDEGCRLSAYQDTMGIWTVGYGHAYVHPGTVWTQAQADAQLLVDVQAVISSLDIHLPWWTDLADLRHDVLVNMAFNMGVSSLCQFHNTLSAVQSQNWKAAHDGMLASQWASQVKGRAIRLANQMLTDTHV